MGELKVSELKKHLKNYDQKELIQLVTNLYKLNKEVQQFLSIEIKGEETVIAAFKRRRKKLMTSFSQTKVMGTYDWQKPRKPLVISKS